MHEVSLYWTSLFLTTFQITYYENINPQKITTWHTKKLVGKYKLQFCYRWNFIFIFYFFSLAAQVRNLTNTAFKVADQVTRTILANRIPGEPAMVLKSKLFTIVAERKTPEKLNNSVLASGAMKLPPVEELILNPGHQQYIDTKVSMLPKFYNHSFSHRSPNCPCSQIL